MTQEQKDILLKDLCSRLPYGVKGEKYTIRMDGEFVPLANIEIVTAKDIIDRDKCPGYTIKPYLFPLSSMTEEQKEEFNLYIASVPYYGDNMHIHFYSVESLIEFYNKHHLDWRGLIPMGLAIDATGKNIY